MLSNDLFSSGSFFTPTHPHALTFLSNDLCVSPLGLHNTKCQQKECHTLQFNASRNLLILKETLLTTICALVHILMSLVLPLLLLLLLLLLIVVVVVVTHAHI